MNCNGMVAHNGVWFAKWMLCTYSMEKYCTLLGTPNMHKLYLFKQCDDDAPLEFNQLPICFSRASGHSGKSIKSHIIMNTAEKKDKYESGFCAPRIFDLRFAATDINSIDKCECVVWHTSVVRFQFPNFTRPIHSISILAHKITRIKRTKNKKKNKCAGHSVGRVADVSRFVLPMLDNIVLIFLIADNYSMTQNNVFYGL